MKKILIASACAFALCFTSCASKKAPDTEAQTEAPENENLEEENASDTENSETEDSQDNENEVTLIEETTTVEDFEALTSEDFPEPENIDEPDIITLEPQNEIEEDISTQTEIVENEEPPEITILNPAAEENVDDSHTDTASSTLQNENEENNPDIIISEDSDITDADVIIVNPADSDDISGGIDITDDESETEENLSQPEKEIIPSRSVTLKKFEYLDITYPGTGWIYMGLTDNSKDLAYFGRKLGTKDTKFSLQARAAGKKIIHFYRNDPLTGKYLDDYIEVIITTENGSNKTHIQAPEYKLPVQKKESPKKVKEAEETVEDKTDKAKEKEQTSQTSQTNQVKKTEQNTQTTQATKTTQVSKKVESSQSSETKTTGTTATATPSTYDTQASETSASGTEASNTSGTADPDNLLKEAQLLYNEKEFKAALEKLKLFFELSTDNRDKALYLQGQILEAKSDVRDIKAAIDAYTTLTKNYPASKFWDSANKRIIYLKRFYLEVR